MKKICAFILALAVCLPAPALAREPELVIAPAPASYSAILTLNGETLDTAGLPAAPGTNMLPLRLLAEADHGSAYWNEEDNESWFTFGEDRITVKFADNSVLVNDQPVEARAGVVRGVTFVPAGVLELLEGFSVNTNPELSVYRLDVLTPNNDPMIKLAYQLVETAGMGYGMRSSAADMEEYHGIHADNFTQAFGFFPMMVSPDTLILGKVAQGKLDTLKAELEAYRQGQEDTFSWYLAQHLPKVQNAQVAVSGDWVLFVIAEHAGAAVEQFEEAVKGL